MAYYLKVLQPNENVKYVGKLHWVIYKHAIFLVLVAIFCGLAASFAPADNRDVIRLVAVVIFGVAVLSFLQSWFVRASTEIVVTDKRIIHKVGWIARRTEEMNVSKVETVDVSQGVAGRVLGYGTVLMRGIGGSWEPLRYVASPLELRNSIMVG
jgi:uncharacterized membrane protein YdbT with pleckstrin-like domain